MKKFTILIIIYLFALLFNSNAIPATRTASVNGNWNSTATWGGASVPTSADDVIINDNITVTVNVAAYCNTLTINGGNNSTTLTISDTNSLTVTGAVTINWGGQNNKDKGIQVGTGTLSCASVYMNYDKNAKARSYISLSSGSITVTGNITMDGIPALNQINITSTGTLFIGGNVTGGDITDVTGSTVNYNGSSAQTIYQKNYNGNVICSGSGVKTFGTTGSAQTISNNLTVKTGCTLLTADITGLQLSINGVFTVESGASVIVGGVNNLGGRIIVNGISNHIINGNINIYFALRFNGGTTSGAQSTVAVKNPAIITTEYSTGGQLYLSNNVIVMIESGAEFRNNNVNQGYYLGGLYNDNLKPPPQMIIDGTWTNGPNGSITNEGVFKINGIFNYPSGWWNTGTRWNLPIEYGTSGKLVYTGGALMTSRNEWPATLGPQFVTINSTGIITLDSHKTVPNTLKMISGNLNTGAFTLTLGTSSSNLGTLDYSSGVIITGATGGFKRWFAASTVSNVFFPVGTTTSNNTITLSFTGAPSAGSLTAKFIAENPGSALMEFLYDVGILPEPNPYMIDCYSQRGYWQLDAGDGLTEGTYNISLRGQGFNPTGSEITNYTELRVLKRTNGAGNPWTVPPTHVPATGSNSDPIIQRSGLSGFSQYGMGGNWGRGNPLQGPLPVKLTSFNSVISGRDVKLVWITESEENNEGFEVQKSEYRIQESEVWNKIGFVKGNGTKNSATNYTFEDKNLQTGKYKYRLKQIDYNGNYEYFELAGVIEVGVPKKFDLSQNYPNPFNPVTKINFDLPESGLVALKIYDILGKEVASLVNETRKAGYYTVTFDASALSSGVYFYRLSLNGFSSVKRMAVIK